MLREVERGWNIVASLPMTPEEEQKGRELFREIEASRLERMQTPLRGSNTAGVETSRD